MPEPVGGDSIFLQHCSIDRAGHWLIWRQWYLRIKRSAVRPCCGVTTEPAELYEILKFGGLVTTGGEAKLLIGDGQVSVNGEIKTRRRRKMVSGDVIEFRGDRLKVPPAHDPKLLLITLQT
jgi:ribosome-associated protein